MFRDLALVLAVVIVVGAFLAVRALYARDRARLSGAGRVWHTATHGLPGGGVAVTIECSGEPPQTVRELPADLPAEEFADALAEAEAEADAKAAALNASRSLP